MATDAASKVTPEGLGLQRQPAAAAAEGRQVQIRAVVENVCGLHAPTGSILDEEIDLEEADTLATMRSAPGRCHELRGDRAGQLSLDLDHPYRLLLRPVGDPEPGPGGGLDWSAVRAVVVIGIEDTHR